MSEKNSFTKILPFQNTNSASFTGLNFTKQQNTLSSNLNNNNKTFSLLLNMEENNNKTEINQEKNKKNTLIIKKINLNESKYNYYSKAMKTIFFSPKYYLQNYYKGKKVVVGENKQLFKDIKDNKDLLDLQRLNIKNKSMNNKGTKNVPKFSVVMLKRAGGGSKSFLSSRLQDIDKFTTIESNRSHRTRKNLKKSTISDYELKLIYKEVLEREKNNKNKKIDFLNETWGLGENQMLKLQEKILRKNKKKHKFHKYLINKIIEQTFKDKKNVLMDQKKQLLILKNKKLDKELTKFSIFHQNLEYDTKSWAYNLRKQIKNKKEEEEKCFTPTKKINKEIIYYNRDFSTISSDRDIKKIFYKKINKRIDKDKIRNKKMDVDLNSFHSLNIQGKKLLEHEIKLNNLLLGKKKKIFYYNYNKNEISSILLAQSTPREMMTTPRVINNSIKLHKLKL